MILNYLIYFFVFLFGLCIGSFLNCIIYRLKKKKKINGRSFCPRCKHALSWQDLFPVFSFIFLKRKCKYCNKKISWQYPLVELATGMVFVLAFNFAKDFSVAGFLSVAFLFYIFSSLVVIFVYDLKHCIIPDKVLFPAIIAALIYNIIFPGHLFYNFLAAIVAAGFFLAIFLISKGRWMGFGDVKLAILMGLLLGLPDVLAALFLAFFLGAIIGVILMIFEKKGLKSEIPFGPFLIAGTLVAIFWGPQIIQWYLRMLI